MIVRPMARTFVCLVLPLALGSGLVRAANADATGPAPARNPLVAHPNLANGCDTTLGGPAPKEQHGLSDAAIAQVSSVMGAQQAAALQAAQGLVNAPTPRPLDVPPPGSGPPPGQFIDPNFAWPCGDNQAAGEYPLAFWWRYEGNKVLVYFTNDPNTSPFSSGRVIYYGFDARGSYVHKAASDIIYLWNGEARTLTVAAAGTNKDPAAPPGDLDTRGSTKALKEPAWVEYDKTSRNATLSKASDGTASITYTAEPDDPAALRTFKVVRGTAPLVTDAMMKHILARLPPQYRPNPDIGPWVWIGTGSQAGIARLFTFNADGSVRWELCRPAVARSMLSAKP
jgi:hypothetical protein